MTKTISRSRMVGYALAAAVVLTLPGAAWAHCKDHNGPCADHNGPCAEDVKTLCPDASTREDVHRCLREHADDVSPACAEKMAARRERFQAIRSACQADLDSLCPDAQGRDIGRCLHEHRSELSGTCSQTLDSMHKNCSEHTQG